MSQVEKVSFWECEQSFKASIKENVLKYCRQEELQNCFQFRIVFALTSMQRMAYKVHWDFVGKQRNGKAQDDHAAIAMVVLSECRCSS